MPTEPPTTESTEGMPTPGDSKSINYYFKCFDSDKECPKSCTSSREGIRNLLEKKMAVACLGMSEYIHGGNRN